MTDVQLASHGSFWIVGSYKSPAQPMALHLVGGSWQLTSTPAFDGALVALATGPGGVWAEGDYWVANEAPYHSFLLRWDGSAWVSAPVTPGCPIRLG